MNNNQKEILNLISKFGCLTTTQIENITKIKNVDKVMNPLVKQKNGDVKQEDDRYFLSSLKKPDAKLMKALEVYSYLSNTNKPVEWCMPVEFPFTVSLFRNNKVFDIAVLDEGEEIVYCPAINRSNSERVLFILDDIKQIKNIRLDKPYKICFLKPKIQFLD